LERAGLFSRLHRPPAICFLEITGYTRLTEERGDEAAADLATSSPPWSDGPPRNMGADR
jgi:class 3 adenylate cyclase